MNPEYWTYKKINGRVQCVYKINEISECVSIHMAAQKLIDSRGYGMAQAYEYLNGLHHI